MASIFQRALGPDFARLHPQIQRRFGFDSTAGIASVGTGVMDEVWHGRSFTKPFLYLGTLRRIMFPDSGRHVPFTVRNYAYRDRFGRETITWLREFGFHRPRRFDAYMIYSERRGRVVDYLGTHQHLAVDIDLAVDDRGGIRLRSGAQRFYENLFEFRFPMHFSGVADVCEWYDDQSQRFQIEVSVTNPRFGPLFGYRGSFTVEWHRVPPGAVPRSVLPRRVERRE